VQTVLKKKFLIVAIGISVIAIAVAVAVLDMLSQPTTPQTVSRDPKLGLVVMAPTQTPTLTQIVNAYDLAASTGIGRSNVYLSWPTIEPVEGQYDWKTSDILMSLNRHENFNVTLYFSIINDRELGPFPSWMGNPQLDQKLQNEIVQTLDTILTRYYIVDYVIIGGGLDEYFRDHPNDVPKYVQFFDGVYAQLKQKHPTVKFGNWFSLNGLINHYQPDLVSKLNQGDFVAYSYAPVDSLYFEYQSPQEEGKNLQKMIDFAGGKKIALIEVSWSTSQAINGTSDDQVKFMKIVYDFYRQNESQFEFLTWYRQYDRPIDTCLNALNPQQSSIFGNQFLKNNTANYLCNSGLFDVDLNPKPAWDEFKKEIQFNPNS